MCIPPAYMGGMGLIRAPRMAAPQVAGLAALIWKQHPALLPSEVRNHIMYTSKDVHAAGLGSTNGTWAALILAKH